MSNPIQSLLDDVVQKVHEELMVKTLTNIVNNSPVDTGRYKAHQTVILPGDSPSSIDWVRYDKEGATVLPEGLGKIKRIAAYTRTSIENPLPYSLRLEEGWSKQAPAGVYDTGSKAALLSMPSVQWTKGIKLKT